MLLDEWSDQDLELARAIGPGRSDAAAGGRRAGAGGSADGDGPGALQALRRLDAPDPLADSMTDPLMDPRRGPIRGLDPFDDGFDADPLPDPHADRCDGARDHGIGGIGGIDDADAHTEGAAIVLDLKSSGGDGVVLSISIDGQRARAWVDAEAWCEWLAPRLAVQRFPQIPPDLLGLLGDWTLLPLQHRARRAGLGLPRFCSAEPGSCVRAIAPTLTLCRADAELDLRLLDWPETWIAALAQTMEDRRPPLTIPPIPVALAAGWVRLTRAQLARLSPGDGVVLERPAAIEHGHAWLVAERPLALAYLAHGA